MDLRMWTGGSYDCDDVMRALVRLDRPEIRPGTSGQNGKTIPTYFTDPEVDAPTIVPGSESCTPPSVTDHTGTRLSMQCSRTPIFARMERRRSLVMELSPLRVASALQTIVRRKLKRMRYRRYFCRLDQLSDIPGTGLPERIPTQRTSPEVSLVPDEVQVTEIGDHA